VDPNSSRHIVASEAGGPTHVTFDGGVTWGDAAGLPAHSFSVTIDPNDSKTLLALSNASNNITGGVYRSTDGGLNLDTEFRNYRRFRRAAEHRLQPDAAGR
jgi:hypothetical protein